MAGAVAWWHDTARRNGVLEQEITMMAESIEPRMNTVIAMARKT